MIVRKTSLLMMAAAVLCMLCSAAYAVTYQYDTQNRLIKARFDDGTVEEYTYDKAGNRQVKIGRVSDNNPPVAQDDAVATWENNPCSITLIATDADEDPLTYLFESDPGHGTLSGTPPNLTYTPDTQYDGPDSFKFKVHDGEDAGNVATVSITMTNVNLAPVAYNQCLSTNKDAALSFTLEAEDPDEAPLPLTYTLVTEPENGVLSGTVPDFTYTPNAGFEGHETFTFKVNDGLEDSNTATVTINMETFVPVMWVDAVGVIVNDNSLRKTVPSGGWPHYGGDINNQSGAASDQIIYGNGAVEVVARDTTNRVFGLAYINVDNLPASIDYAFKLTFVDTYGDRITICEKGVNVKTLGYYKIGDRFIIERTGSTIVYKWTGSSGTVTYTSTQPSSGSLLVDTSIYTVGGTISEAKIRGGRGADVDHDLDVDADDRALLLGDMGRTDCPRETDLNADGIVNENDLAILNARPEGNYGKQIPPGPTYVGGIVRDSWTWTLAGHPYIVMDRMEIYGTTTSKATLTIEPGVVVKFASQACVQIGTTSTGTSSFASLRAVGTKQAPILFTTTSSTLAAGKWNGLRFYDSTDDADTILDHCIVEYAGQYSGGDWQSSIFCDRASPTITNSIIRYNLYNGFHLKGCSTVISDCEITDCGVHGIYIADQKSIVARPHISGTTIQNVGLNSGGDPGSVIFATYNTKYHSPIVINNTFNNWEGSLMRIGAGALADVQGNLYFGNGNRSIDLHGDSIKRNTTFGGDEIKKYKLLGGITINHDQSSNGTDPSKITTVTIEPGVSLLFNSGTNLIVGASSDGKTYYGALRAIGSAAAPIIFTTSSSSPSPGQWKGIRFYDPTDDSASILDHCVVEYGGQYSGGQWISNIFIQSAAPTISNSIIRQSLYHGIHAYGCSPIITCNNILDNTKSGVLAESSAKPLVNRNNIIGNKECGVKNATSSVTINAQRNYWLGNTTNVCGNVDAGNPLSEPYDADDDDDGIPNDVEDANGNGICDAGETDWQSADTDGDGIQDGTELGYTLDMIGEDTDQSVFIPDADPTTTTDPNNQDTDGDGINDGDEDLNHNGAFEPELGETDPSPRLALVYVDAAGLCSGNTPCYASMQEAINVADDADTIYVRDGNYDEDIVLNEQKAIKIQGGWDETFTSDNSESTVVSVTISKGEINARNIAVKPVSE